MDERHYPDLPEGAASALNIVQLQMQEDHSYLDDESCPYSEEDRKILHSMFGTEARSRPGDDETIEVPEAELETRISQLFRDLESFGDDLGDASPQEKAAFFRVATSLTEKIVTLKERTSRVKDFKQFQNAILSWVEDELDTDQRTHFMDYVKDFS